jgi:Holliday junction resolvase RusA-like endonuclease
MPTFIINGRPVSLVRQDKLTQAYWDALKQYRQSAITQLENQLQDLKPFEKPIHLDIQFYFVPIGKHKPRLLNGYSHSRPDISDLIRFVENVSDGILFKDSSIIASIASTKRYSDNARTEIIIKEL